jgi:DNA-directed RNA polymerase specialized sigma54-like protein
MILAELQEQALKLTVNERLQLANTLLRSVQSNSESTSKIKGLVPDLIGIARTKNPPSDEEVKAMLDEHRVQKYL